jgi:uncharacterized repeat protein (TIGR01451 family)
LAVAVLAFIALCLAPTTSASLAPLQSLAARMSVDQPYAAPGDAVTFTIDVTKIPGDATTLTINDSLPVGLRFDSSSEPTACARAGTVWSCNPSGVTNVSIAIHLRVELGARGKDLVNHATINVFVGDRGVEPEEAGGAPQSVEVQAIVQIVASDITIRLGAAQVAATPGQPLNYRIDLLNGGVGPAVNATIVATLPQGAQSDSVYPRPTKVDGQRLEWSVDAIPVGSYQFLFNASFLPEGSVPSILASASVTYVDSNGVSPQREETAFTLPVVAAQPPGGASTAGTIEPLSTIAMTFAAAGAGLVLVQKFVLSPRPARLRIDQLFLLHRSGLVMNHFAVRHLGAGDPDIQGAMLTAVQSYLENSVDASAGPLLQIGFGARDIIFANGGNAILAAVIRKGDPAVFFATAPGFLRTIEDRNGPALDNWDGMSEKLDGIDGAFRSFTKDLLAHRG